MKLKKIMVQFLGEFLVEPSVSVLTFLGPISVSNFVNKPW